MRRGQQIAEELRLEPSWRVTNNQGPEDEALKAAEAVLWASLETDGAQPHLDALRRAIATHSSERLLAACSGLFGYLDPMQPEGWEVVLDTMVVPQPSEAEEGV